MARTAVKQLLFAFCICSAVVWHEAQVALFSSTSAVVEWTSVASANIGCLEFRQKWVVPLLVGRQEGHPACKN